MLIQVYAKHFTAGIIVHEGTVVEAAPILGWTVGKDIDYLTSYFKRKGWLWKRVESSRA